MWVFGNALVSTKSIAARRCSLDQQPRAVGRLSWGLEPTEVFFGGPPRYVIVGSEKYIVLIV